MGAPRPALASELGGSAGAQSLETSELEDLKNAAKASGVAPLARKLRMARSTLTGVVAGTARDGSVALAVLRWRALRDDAKTQPGSPT